MSDIQWTIRKVKVSDLLEYEHNPRTLSDSKLKHLEDSIKKFGVAEPLVANSNNVICGGHGRRKILLRLNIKEVDCYYPNRELDAKEFDELNIRLNKNTAGSFDYDMLGNRFDVGELSDMGFTDFDLGIATSDESNPFDLSDDNYEPEEQRLQNSIISYALVFDNVEQQTRFYEFLSELKQKYPETETHAERIDLWLKAK